MTDHFDAEMATYYSLGMEGARLHTWGRLEAVRTTELLDRYLPAAPAVVLDIGGGEGAYALPLALAGYTVHLLDGFGPHVAAARASSARQSQGPLASAEVGDARKLPYGDGSADAVLLLGPLYHLIDRADRLLALTETMRVLRPGGVLLAAAISRFASVMDGLSSGAIADPIFARMVADDIRHGVHRNPDPVNHPGWFTLAYFHRPEELRHEVAAVGFVDVNLLAIEGVGSLVDTAATLTDPAMKSAVLQAIRRLESEPALLGASPHIMAIANRAG